MYVRSVLRLVQFVTVHQFVWNVYQITLFMEGNAIPVALQEHSQMVVAFV